MTLILSLWAFYVFYLACMSLYRGHKQGTLTLASKVMGYPIMAVGLVLDVAMNVTVFSIVFMELPREWLVTARLKRHIKQHTIRAKVASFLCEQLLSPFDVDGNHCQ